MTLMQAHLMHSRNWHKLLLPDLLGQYEVYVMACQWSVMVECGQNPS